jgi:hypothetical protein
MIPLFVHPQGRATVSQSEQFYQDLSLFSSELRNYVVQQSQNYVYPIFI